MKNDRDWRIACVWHDEFRVAFMSLIGLAMVGCGGEAQNPLPDASVVIAVPADAAAALPRIVVPPRPLIVADGGRAVFGVQVTGRGPFAFQWQRDGVDIAGAREATLVIAAAQRADDGAHYRVEITGSAGRVRSESVRLGVEPAGWHEPFEQLSGAL
jgi:hypothetical protein